MEQISMRPSPDALLNPRYDAIFKALFTDNSPQSRFALQSFLEAILDAKVSDIRLQPNVLAVESVTDKNAVFDISCVLNDLEAVNIEMQGIDVTGWYDRRAEYYVAHLLNHHTRAGLEWEKVPKVYQISVLNFIYDDRSDDFLSKYSMATHDNRNLSGRMNIYFIELPKLLGSDIEEIDSLTPAEKWVKFFLYADDAEKKSYINELCSSSGGIMAAQESLFKISKDESNWVLQTWLDKKARDELSMRNEAMRAGQAKGHAEGFEKGHAEGFEKGHAEGISEGLEKGLAEGLAEGHEKGLAEGHEKGLAEGLEKGLAEGLEKGIQESQKQTVCNALKMGLSVQQIVELTGLSEGQVKNLSEN